VHGIAHYAQEAETLLGEHQDAIVAANFLAALSVTDDRNKNSGFTYGILMVNELHRAAVIRQSLRG
jgi:hypothetical protein